MSASSKEICLVAAWLLSRLKTVGTGEGMFAGGSAGAALAAAVRYAARLAGGDEQQAGDRLGSVILPYSGSRYLSKF